MTKTKGRIYLDYAATTPMDAKVLAAMRPYFGAKFGNPGSLHSFGQEAIGAVDSSRETIAKAIGAEFREIIFTGSATEANNLALRGCVSSIKYQVSGSNFTPRVIVSAIEHESVIETARALERDGAAPIINSLPQGPSGARLYAGEIYNGVEVIYIPVDKRGIVDLKKLQGALNERTILVSIMYANNEIGAIQPIAKISKIIGDFRNELGIRNEESTKSSKFPIHNSLFPFFHTDAVQALQFLDCNVDSLGVDPVRNSSLRGTSGVRLRAGEISNGVDLMTVSAHKIYGPKGVGALYIKNNSLGNPFVSAIISGGGQEFGLRSGTENVPNIVGFAKAVELAARDKEKEAKRLGELRNYLRDGIKKICLKAEVNGEKVSSIPEKKSKISYGASKYPSFAKASEGEQVSRKETRTIATLPNILNVYFPDYKAEEIMVGLDLAGVAVSSGAACSSRAARTSHVITALGYDSERARRSIRFSLGRPTTKQEIDTTLKIFKNLISRLKK